MNRRIRTWLTVSLAAVGAFTVVGCDDTTSDKSSPASPAGANSSAAAASEALPPDLVLADAPSGAKDVADVRKTAKDGDAVVVRGRVGGREQPFTEGRASFVLMDANVKSCAEMEGDAC